MHCWIIRMHSCTPIPSIYLWRHHITSVVPYYHRNRSFDTIMLILPRATATNLTKSMHVMHCWRSAERIRSPIPSIYLWRHHITSVVPYYHRNRSFERSCQSYRLLPSRSILGRYLNWLTLKFNLPKATAARIRLSIIMRSSWVRMYTVQTAEFELSTIIADCWMSILYYICQ